MIRFEGESSGVDLLSPEALADPQGYYARIRARGRLVPSERWGGLIATHWRDVVDLLKNPRMSSRAFARFLSELSPERRERWPLIVEIFGGSMVYRDPPDHTRLRALINKAFTRTAVEALRPRIRALVDEYLDRVERNGRMDVVRDLAGPLPVAVIADFMGVPVADAPRMKEWSDEIAALILGELGDPARHDRAEQALGRMTEYLGELVRERRARPTDDLVSALALARERQSILTDGELVGMCVLLLFAGHETTTNLIANGLLALLDHPEEAARATGGLPPTAIDELLRWDGPMKALSRVVKEPFELDGRHLAAGERVLLALTAANRDPDRFSDPERLDLWRADNPHVAFGSGIHYCLGAPLSKLEGHIALEALLQRFGGRMRLAVPRTELRWRPALLVRSLVALPVVFE